MRILQISTSDIGGGAARAAHRLHRGLSQMGQSSSMLVKTKLSDDPQVSVATLDLDGAQVEINRARWIEKYWLGVNRTPLSTSYFSVPFPGFDLAQNAAVLEADVLNLHWVSGLLNPAATGLLQRVGKPVFWTLHDQRAFTGGCHFSAGCTSFQTTCDNCPQLTDDKFGVAAAGLRESALMLAAREIVVICPSRWMADQARKSAIFRSSRVEAIPNGIDTEIFRARPKREARLSLGIRPDAICFLFGGDNFQEKRKGFAPLLEILRKCCADSAFRKRVENGEIQWLGFGDTGDYFKEWGLPIKSFGRIEKESEIARLYAAADAFLLPSLEDNLPNVMLESMCCGTPVVGFSIGGLPDFVIPGETGFLAKAGDEADFAAIIKRLADDAPLLRGLAETCAKVVPARASIGLQASRYLSLYREQMMGRTVLPAPKPASVVHPLVPSGLEFNRVARPLLKAAKRNRRTMFWRRLAGPFWPR